MNKKLISALGINSLQQYLLETLLDKPSGYTEYELLKLLQAKGEEPFQNIQYHNPTALFRVHFCLFHQLYRLQQILWNESQVYLEVSPLGICITEGNRQTTDNSLTEHNPLREFYLENNNLDNTSGHEIKQMLDRFWQLMSYHEKEQLALTELELQKPVSFTQIKRQYKRLSLRHHPDRGGDKEKFQNIYEAMKVLARLHGKTFK